MDSLKTVLEVFQPDFVFSLCFFVGFIGFGLFFSRQVWPWAQKYLDKKLEYDYQINRQRWEVMQALTDSVGEMKTQFSAFHENQRHILAILQPKHGTPET